LPYRFSVPRTVYLVRHTAPAVAPGTCYGAADVSLDAAHFAQDLPCIHAQLPHDVQLISSPLSRCAALAQALHAQSPARTLRFDARLSEMSFGHWQGQRWDAIDRAALDAWAANFMHYNGHGGESPAQVQARVLAVWQAIPQESQRAVALITHAGPMRVIQAHIQAKALEQFTREIAYGAVFHVDT
jgi:alpha-ribazole phosphatase